MKSSFLCVVLCLAVSAPGPRAWAQDSDVIQESVDRTRTAGLSDRSPGATVQAPGSDVKLVADEEGGKVVARLTWGNEDRTSLFAIEAAATLQKGAEEVSLLNLDGLAGGDDSLEIAWTRSGRWLRGQKRGAPPPAAQFRGVCQDINAALESDIAAERCPRCPTTAPPSFQPLPPAACTPERLDNIGGSWAEAAKNAETEALQAACDELTKLDSKRVFLPVGAPAGGGLVACSAQSLAASLASERQERRVQEAKLQAEIEGLGEQLEEKIVALAQLDAAFAEVAGQRDRERIAHERLVANRKIASLEAEITTKQAAIKALWPALLQDPSAWQDKKLAEQLGAVCKTYNSPDRSAKLVLEGNAQTCFTEAMKAAIREIEDPAVQSALTRKMWQAAPVGVWFLTFSAGASNQDFQFADLDSLAGAATFQEIEDRIVRDSETNTSLGITWAAQFGGNYFSLGYERRNKFSGGKATELCAPADTDSAILRCVGTTAGAPTELDQNIGLVEWRRFVATDLGLKARVFYVDDDIRLGKRIKGEWEAHLIGYFLRHVDKGLNGGIDVGWDTFTEDVTARVFIGQAFDIFD